MTDLCWSCPAHKNSQAPYYLKVCLFLFPGEIPLPAHTSMGDARSPVARIPDVHGKSEPFLTHLFTGSLSGVELALAFRSPV